MENLTMSSLANLSIHFLMSSLSSSKIFLPPQENTSFSDALPTLSQSTRDSMLGSLLNNDTRSMVTRFQDGLVPDTDYFITVAATTSAGKGIASGITVRTHESIPGSPPINLKYHNLSSTSIHVSWDPPLNPNGIITGYTVGISSRDGMIKQDTDENHITVTNLLEYHPYEVYVWPWTLIGEGPSSVKLHVHTAQSTPGSPPLNVTYKNITSSVIKVQWHPPLTPNGIITQYTVYYENSTGTFSQKSNEPSTVIERLKPYGLYLLRVTSSTKVGEGPKSAVVTVRTMEGQPTTPPFGLSYVNITSTSVNMAWLKPITPNGIIQFYDVILTEENNLNKSRLLHTPGKNPSLLISGLKPHSFYTAVVRTNTKYGDGDQESKPLNIWTLEDVPGSSPRLVSYINESSTSIKLSWQPPLERNGLITLYTIKYSIKSEPDKNEVIINVPGQDNQVTIIGLKEYTFYDFSISASTRVGEGPVKNIEVLTDEGEPTSPPYNVIYNQLSSTAIVLSWQPPLHPNGIIINYTVAYSNGSRVLRVTSVQPEVTLTNLRKFGEYSAYVTARTRVGDGLQRSRTISFKTLEDAPSDPPSDLAVIPISSTSLKASWLPPKSPNGLIQFYTLYYQTDDSAANTLRVTNNTESLIPDLQKYTWYDVWVTASTALGDGGHKSRIVRIRTQEDVPDSAVENLFGEADSSTSISVNWNVATPITGPTYFLVTVQPITAQSLFDDNVFEANVTKENLTVTDLVPFTSYLVTVISKVYGVPGNGPKAEVVVTTDEDRPMSSVVDFKISRLTSTSANLTWKPPVQANGVITFYNVYISPGQLNKSTPGNQTFGLMRNLEKFSTYKAVISSSTIVGSGPQATLNFTTLQDVPSDSPQNLEVSKITNTSALLSWDSPLHPNGILTYFTLRYRSASLPSDVITALYPAKSVVLDNLLPHSNYFVSASASTKIGMGPYTKSPLEFTTEEGIPGAPRKLNCISLDNHTILISWMDPEHSNGVLKKFDVTYKNAKNGNKGYTSASHTVSSFNISGLVPHSLYQVDVRASTRVGSGPPAQCNVTTEEGLPSPPVKIKAMEVTATSITVNWEPPISPHGIIRGYDVIYVPPDACKDNNGVTKHLDHNQRCVIKVGVTQSKHLFHLNKYTDYRISIRAYSGKGVGLLASPGIEQRTSTGVPDFPVRNVQVSALSSTSINVSWQEPLEFAGVTSYLIKAINTKTKKVMQSNELNQLVKSQVLTELQPYSTYEVSVTVITSAGSLTSSSRSIATKQDVPYDPPSNISTEAIPKNSSAVIIFFRAPKHRNGPIMSYSVEYKTKQNQDVISVNVSTSHLHDFPVNFNQFYSWNLTGLLGGRTYVFRMRASTEVGSGPWSPWGNTLTTPVTAPPVPQSIPSISKTGTTSSSITVGNPCVFSNANGALSSISVVVAEDGADLTKSPTTWHEAYFIDPSPPYMVLYSNNPEKDCLMTSSTNGRRRKRSAKNIKNDFVIGNDNSCKEKKNQFCNGPLKSNSFYRFKYRAETVQGQVTYTMFSQPVQTAPSFLEANSSLIIGVAVAAVVFIALLTAAVIIIRRRKNASQNTLESDYYSRTRSKSPMKNDEEEETIKGPFVESGHQDNSAFVLDSDSDKVTEVAVSRPVSKLDFGGHISRLCMNKNKGFSSEFDDIRGLPTAGTTSSSDKPFNRTKNRHAKLVPFDQFRVKLETISGIEGSDYINASFIPGQLSVNQFIATQYPLEHTKKDFWKMMWETKASTIALLGNQEEEKKRPDTFWPRKQSETYGPFAVQLKQEDIHPEWTIRHFILSSRDQSREITQFHLTKWPISDGSGGSQIILRFVQTVRASRSIVGLPLVVMCSSGSGKSGVFICLDRLLENLQLKSHVDVFGTVAAVRRYRPYMVQSMGEYILVYQCMQEAINEKVGLRRPPTGDGLEETVF